MDAQAALPLTADEEALYREGLLSAPTVAGLAPETTTLTKITVAEWADRCRRILATLDQERASREGVLGLDPSSLPEIDPRDGGRNDR